MKLSKEFLVGTLVVVAIALLYIGVNYLKGVNLFTRQVKFYAVYENSAGLTASNPVILNGFKVGIVSEVGMNKNGDGTIVVEIILDAEGLTLPMDTRLQIYDADLFGGKAIQLIMGDSIVLAEDKDTLQSEIALGLTETLKQEIEPLKQKTSQLFGTLDSIMSSLNHVFQDSTSEGVAQVFKSLQRTMLNLESTTGNLDVLLADNKDRLSSIFKNVESISSNIEANNETLTKTIQNFSTLSDTLAKLELASTLMKVDKAMSGLEETIQKINSGEGTLGQLVNNDSLHTELVNASHSLDLLLNDMKENPKRYVSFSVFGGKKESEKFSKKELEQLRDEIDKLLKEKEASGKE